MLWGYRLELLTYAARRVLDSNGLGPVEVTFDRLDLHELHARDIRLLGGAIEATEFTLHYSPLDLLAKHLSEATIVRPRLAAALEGDAVKIGNLPLGASSSSSGSWSIGGINIDTVEIVDGQVSLDRPGGRLETTFSTKFALAGAGLQNAVFSIDIPLPVGATDYSVHIAVPRFSLMPEDANGFRLSFNGAELAPKSVPWSAEGIGGDVLWRSDQVTAKIVVGKLVNRQQPALIEPSRLSADLVLAGTRLDFELRTETAAAGANGKISLDAKGRHDLASESGSARITMAPIVFRPKGLQPSHFSPALAGMLSAIGGSASLAGEVSWHGASLRPDLTARLKDVELNPQGARLQRINGEVKLNGLWPPATPPGQELSGTVEVGSLPPSEVTLAFQILPKPTLLIERMRLGFAGGTISASPFAIDPAIPAVDTVLQFEEVDLAEVSKLIDIEGLDGTGQLDGHIPLNVSEGRVRIGDGVLAARGPGMLHFKSGNLPKQITEAGEEMQLALQVLENFHYESLILELNKSAGGEGAIILRLKGNNPAVLDGRPFNLNIRLESNFDKLTDLALSVMAKAQELLRRAAGRAQQ